LYAWAQAQAARLREGAWRQLDLAHLIEEIEDVGHSQRDALGSHLLILLTHLLKLAYAAGALPHEYERAGLGWRRTCRTQRRHVAKVLRRNPSMRPLLPNELVEAYEIARLEAAEVFENDEAVGTPICSWTPAQILNDDFWPEEATPSGPRGEQRHDEP
jgi:hypothetical protein